MKAHSHGGNAAGWIAPVQTRSERLRSADVHAFAPVTGREAEWKYTPVDRLSALLDGPLGGSRFEVDAEQRDGVSLAWVPRSEAVVGVAGLPEDRAAANAWSQSDDVLTVTVEGDVAEPVHVTRRSIGDAPRAAHILVTAKPGSRATLVLGSEGQARLAENVEIVVEDEADLTIVVLEEWEDDAIHLAEHHALVGRGARLRHILVSLGGGIIRVNPSARLAGEGGEAELLGLYFADAGQHIEHQVFLHHEGAHTKGNVNYKGALQGKGAHTVWIGDVLIGRDATGTDTYEQNRNLVLTEGTRADSVPNLEIETGEIVGAGHASATGRFDDEQLFYLQARGIPEAEARRLVVIGFLAEIIQQIGDDALEARLLERVEAELEIGARLAPVGSAR